MICATFSQICDKYSRYTYCVNLCATFTQNVWQIFKLLHTWREFVCYFSAKYVISIQADTYCVNLCATFSQNVWFTLFWRELGHFKAFTLFCRKLDYVSIYAFFCIKFLLPKLWSRKFFDKYHVWKLAPKTCDLRQFQICNKTV